MNKVDIQLIEKTNISMQLVIRGVDVPFMNALRRIMMAEVPSMAIDDIVCGISHLGDSISDAHIATFAPAGTPGVFQDPYPVCPLIVIPADQDDGVICPRTYFVGFENTTAIPIESTTCANRSRNRAIVINGLFYGLSGWHTPCAAYVGPGVDPVRMGVGAATRRVPGHVGEIGFEDCSGLGFARRSLPLMVIVRPPPTIAVPTIRVAGNEVLF